LFDPARRIGDRFQLPQKEIVLVRKSLQIVSVLIVFSFLFPGCGYRMAGSGQLPKGIQRIFIAVFENRTRETTAPVIFTNRLIQEFSLRRRESLASSPETADAVLQGRIQELRIDSVSHLEGHAAIERRVTARVDIDLVDPAGKVIWSVQNLSGRESYFVEGNKRSTEMNRKAAIEVISKRMAELIVNRMTEDF
jgi:hypothetical protein